MAKLLDYLNQAGNAYYDWNRERKRENERNQRLILDQLNAEVQKEILNIKIRQAQREEAMRTALAGISPTVEFQRPSMAVLGNEDVPDLSSMVTSQIPKPIPQLLEEQYKVASKYGDPQGINYLKTAEDIRKREQPEYAQITGTTSFANKRNPLDVVSTGLELPEKSEKDPATASLREFEIANGIDKNQRGTSQYRQAYKTWLTDKKQATHISVGVPSQTSLTEDAVYQEGAKYLLTGKLPFTGMGGAGRKEMINKSAQIAKENGWTPNDVLRMQADYKAMDGSVKNQRKIYDMMTGFVINMDKQMERLDTIYQKLPRSQYKLLNIPFVKLRTIAEGSGEEASAAALLIELGNESGKLSTNSASSIRELSESAQKQWGKVHDQTLSYNELKKVLQTTKQLGHDRLNSTKAAMDFTLQGIQALGKAEQPENPATKTTTGRIKVNPNEVRVFK